jgi:hypothetical protein
MVERYVVFSPTESREPLGFAGRGDLGLERRRRERRFTTLAEPAYAAPRLSTKPIVGSRA